MSIIGRRVVIMLLVCVLACGWAWSQTAGLPGAPAEDATTTTPPVLDTSSTGELPNAIPAATTDNAEEGEVTPPPADTPALPATARRTSLMIKRGQKELEYRVSYSHFSNSTVFIDGVAMIPVLVIGQVGVERTRKDILITSLAARYGLRDNLEAEFKVPFRLERDIKSIPDADPPTEETITGFGLGDVEGGVYVQLPRKSENDVRWVVNAGIKSATGRDLFEIDPHTEVPLGTGFWSTKVGINGVKSSDPAAVYWNFGYTYNWLRKNIRIVREDPQTGDPIVSYADIKPGNTFDVGAGVAYALNPRLSMNTGVSISFSGSSTSDGEKLVNTAITSATLRQGAVWQTGGGRAIDISLAIGLTDDSPDFTAELRQSFQF